MLSLALLAALVSAPADTVRLLLVATTDLHGQVTAWDYVQNAPAPGGLTRAATIIDSLREQYPGQVILVDAGDALQGNVLAAYFGAEASRDPHPVVDAMNTVGYDAATPGNHEFDFGLERFHRALASATFPWVSANLRLLPGDTLALPPFIVLTRNGVRIAVTGFTTPGTMVWHRDLLRGQLRLERIETSAPGILREMRRSADVAIVLSHSGLDGRSSYDTTGVGAENAAASLATSPNRPDVVVVGHTHGEIRDTVIGGVHFVQPKPQGQSLAVVHLVLTDDGGVLKLVRVSASSIPIENTPPNARLVRRLADPHAAALNWAVSVVGEADAPMPAVAARVEDTPLLRFLHDVQRRTTGADLSMAPVFDLRGGFNEGEITVGEVFRFYPYENQLRAVRLSGAAIRAWLEQSARYFFVDSAGTVAVNRFVPGYNYDLLGGARYTIDLSRPAGQRVTRLEVRGRPVAPGDSFTVALSDYRQQGGGNFTMLAGAPVVYNHGENVRQLILAEIRRRRLLHPADFGATGWELAPPELAQRARALFVREAEAPLAGVAAGQAPVILPPRPRSEPTHELPDSAERVRLRADSLARAPVATLRLPAEPGAGRSLPRLLADAYRHALRADVAVTALSEAVARIPAGGVPPSAVSAAAPGASRLYSIRVTGAELLEVLENVLTGPTPCCEVAGVRAAYDPRAREYDRLRRVRLINGAEIEDKQTYLLALSGALIDGDSLFPLGASGCRDGKGCRTPGLLSRWAPTRSELRPSQALADYLRALPQPVTPPADRRLTPNR